MSIVSTRIVSFTNSVKFFRKTHHHSGFWCHCPPPSRSRSSLSPSCGLEGPARWIRCSFSLSAFRLCPGIILTVPCDGPSLLVWIQAGVFSSTSSHCFYSCLVMRLLGFARRFYLFFKLWRRNCTVVFISAMSVLILCRASFGRLTT